MYNISTTHARQRDPMSMYHWTICSPKYMCLYSLQAFDIISFQFITVDVLYI